MSAKVLKLDWFPLFIHRLKASDAWHELTDWEFGWYMKLIVESYDSAKPGYLPNDNSVLWRLAGAKTMAYFQREGQSVLSRFSGRTEDGLWIYHPVVLDVIQVQLKRLVRSRKEAEISFSLSSGVAVAIYEDYPRKEGRGSAIKSIEKAIARESKRQGIEQLSAAELIHKSVLEFAKSPAGRKRKENGESLVPHPSTWFNQDRFLDDKTNWYEETGSFLRRPFDVGTIRNTTPEITEEELAQKYQGYCIKCAKKLEKCTCQATE